MTRARLVGGTFDGMIAELEYGGESLIAIPVVIEAEVLGEKVAVTVYHLYAKRSVEGEPVYGFSTVERDDEFPGHLYAVCPLALERVVAA